MARKTKIGMGALVLLLVVVAGWQGFRISERLWPAFSRDDANAKIGMRVESLAPPSKNIVYAKCPLGNGRCVSVRAGERGTIIQIRAVRPRGYFLVVRWDEVVQDRTPLYSCLGKYTFRTGVKPSS